MQQRLWLERLPAENRSALQLAQSYGIGQMPSYNTGSEEPRSTPFYCGTTHPAQHFWATIVEPFESVTGLEAFETFKTNREALHPPARLEFMGKHEAIRAENVDTPRLSNPTENGRAESRLHRHRTARITYAKHSG
jgi:hypothetical protein